MSAPRIIYDREPSPQRFPGDLGWRCGKYRGVVGQADMDLPYAGIRKGDWTAHMQDERGRALYKARHRERHVAIANVISGPREKIQ